MRNTHFVWSLAIVLSVASAGCGGDTQVPQDAAPDVSAPPDGGCPPGDIGCECDAGSCSEGVCVSGVCSDCRVASEGCTCRSNGSCDTGLRCGDPSMLCETCPAGEEGCACDAGDTCGTGLVCMGALCVADTCTAGAIECPCRTTSPECDSGGTCDSGLCRMCTTDVEGCPCDAGACTGGLVCEADACRAATTCADLVTAGLCAAFQECTESAGVDAVCTDMTCVTGYRWVSATSTCVACVSSDCTAEPTCTAGLPNSLACAAQHRECVEADGVGACDVCVAGFHDEAGVCVADLTCGTAVCVPGQWCDTTAAAGPTCMDWPCASRDRVLDTSGACTITCTRDCAVEGSTGSYWPYADRDGQCVCETTPGYYFDNGGERVPVACDADRDGWVRREVRGILGSTLPDPAILANTRCTVRSAGTVELMDEYGNLSRVDSCTEGLLQDRAPATTCTPFPLRLFESKRNDTGEALSPDETPPYSAGGRAFRTEELNGLTKACVIAGAVGDYDDDGTADISQTQPTPAITATMGELDRLRSFAHFVELYRTGWMPPTAPGGLGTLMIAERSRCEAAFPLSYGSDTTYSAAAPTASAYWRNCERDRSPAFAADAMTPVAGSDFGQYSCAGRSGRCGRDPIGSITNTAAGTLSPGAPAEAVPAHRTHAAMPALVIGTDGAGRRTLTGTLVRDHGLCLLDDMPTGGGGFRGLNHHSQFQCVQVVADGAVAPTAFQRRRSVFGGTSLTTTGGAAGPSTATLTFNTCQLTDGSIAPTTGDGVDPFDPVLDCTVATVGTLPAEGAIGWAAVRYQTYGERQSDGNTPLGDTTYNGGCVNEVAEWPNLCPTALFGTCNAGASDAFGRFCCFGCDSGCPRAHAGGRCTAGASGVGTCDIGSCDVGWGNCDGVDDTGCENDLSSLDNCGGCRGYSDREARVPSAGAYPICSRPNVAETCAEDSGVQGTERCRTLGGCDSGWGNCDLASTTAAAREADVNGCENSLDSNMYCGSCTQQCALPNGAESCGGDICRSGACDTGWYDVDGSTGIGANGCECQDAATNNACPGTSMGSLPSGGQLLASGRIPIASTTAYDWYSVTFSPSGRSLVAPGTAGSGRPYIDFESNPSGQFRFDVFTNGCTSASTCGSGGHLNLTAWEFLDNASVGGPNTYTTQNVTWPSTVYVRVHRAIANNSCDTYNLRARRL